MGNDVLLVEAATGINLWHEWARVEVAVAGSRSETFEAFRTTDDEDRYRSVGGFRLDEQDRLRYEAPARSVTTFFGR